MRFAAILSFGAVASALPFGIIMPWNTVSDNIDKTGHPNTSMNQASTNKGTYQADMVQNMPESMKTEREGNLDTVGRCSGRFYQDGDNENMIQNKPERGGDVDSAGPCPGWSDKNKVVERGQWPKEGDDEDFDKRDRVGNNEMGGSMSNANSMGYRQKVRVSE